MSADLGDTWHQGLPSSPQGKGGLELGSDSDDEDVIEPECENEEDGNYEKLDNAAAGEARDHISQMRESSLWAPLCDCLTPADVLVFAYYWEPYIAKLCGDFVENWFFLMKRKGGDEPPFAPLPGWPSLGLDYRQSRL